MMRNSSNPNLKLNDILIQRSLQKDIKIHPTGVFLSLNYIIAAILLDISFGDNDSLILIL